MDPHAFVTAEQLKTHRLRSLADLRITSFKLSAMRYELHAIIRSFMNIQAYTEREN